MIRIAFVLSMLGLASFVPLGLDRASTPPDPSARIEILVSPSQLSADSRFIDISSTEKGQSRITSAVATAYEMSDQFRHRESTAVKAYAYKEDPTITIVARPETVIGALRIENDPEGFVTVTMESEARPMLPLEPDLVSLKANSSMYWNFVGSDWLRVESDFAYFQPAWHIYKLVNETDSSKDYYAFRHFGTGGPDVSGAYLTDAWIQSWKHTSSPAMSWVDWTPGADVTSSCQSVTLSVAALGIGLSTSAYSRCETWDITLGGSPGTFANDWNGSVQADRQVAYQTVVSVAQGANPIWFWSHSHTGCKLTWTWQCSSAD